MTSNRLWCEFLVGHQAVTKDANDRSLGVLDVLILAGLNDALQRLERVRDLLHLTLQLLAAPGNFAYQYADDVGIVTPRAQHDRAGLAQLLARLFLDLDDRVDRGDHHPPHLPEDRLEDGVFRLEVVVDEPVGDACLLGNVAHAAGVVTLPRERADSCVENLATPLLLGSRPSGHRRTEY